MGIRIACCLKNFIAVENEDPEVLPPSMPNSEPSSRSQTPSVQRNNRGHGCPENSFLVVQYYIRKPVLALAYRKKTITVSGIACVSFSGLKPTQSGHIFNTMSTSCPFFPSLFFLTYNAKINIFGHFEHSRQPLTLPT